MAKIKKKIKDKGKKSFIIWMATIGVLLTGSYAAFLGFRSAPKKNEGAHSHAPLREVSSEAVDPVCGMNVKPPAAGQIEYRARRYYFCSNSCKEDFEKDPEKYLKQNKKEMD